MKAEIRVWDPLVRIFHWSLVLAFAVAYLTEEEQLDLHVFAGYAVLGLVVFRILWGFVGSRYARFSNFLYPPQAITGYTRDVLRRQATRYVGHNPAGGAMIVLLLISLLLATFSGLAIYAADQQAGPLAGVLGGVAHSWEEVLEELHEFFANITLFLVIIHVAGVVVESVLHRENLLRSMWTGRKERRAGDQLTVAITAKSGK